MADAFHQELTADVDHVPEGDHDQSDRRADKHRLAEILPRPERETLPGKEKAQARQRKTSAHDFALAKGPAFGAGPYCLFVFVALSLHTLVVFVLGHFFAPFFLDGTHFFSFVVEICLRK
jgi:hypothetical protein